MLQLRCFFQRRRLFIAVIVAAALAGILNLCRNYHRLPQYQGRSIAEWFADYRRVRTNYLQMPRAFVVQTPNGPSIRTFFVTAFDQTDTLRDRAREALQSMGTEGANWLARQLRVQDGGLRGTYEKLLLKLPVSVQSRLPRPLPAQELRAAAAMALGAIGTNAIPVTPIMIAALKEEPRLSPARDSLIRALQSLPFKEQDLDPVLSELSQRGNFEGVTSIIRELRIRTPIAARALTNAYASPKYILGRPQVLYTMYRLENQRDVILPTLIAAFNSGDCSLMEQASGVLQSFSENAAPSLPFMIMALQSPDPETRYQAVRVIEAIGTNAVSASSVLRNATTDSNDMVRCVAERALCNVTR